MGDEWASCDLKYTFTYLMAFSYGETWPIVDLCFGNLASRLLVILHLTCHSIDVFAFGFANQIWTVC